MELENWKVEIVLSKVLIYMLRSFNIFLPCFPILISQILWYFSSFFFWILGCTMGGNSLSFFNPPHLHVMQFELRISYFHNQEITTKLFRLLAQILWFCFLISGSSLSSNIIFLVLLQNYHTLLPSKNYNLHSLQVSGELVARLENHSDSVRDCSWHPFYPTIVSSSWDGGIASWEFPGNSKLPSTWDAINWPPLF